MDTFQNLLLLLELPDLSAVGGLPVQKLMVIHCFIPYSFSTITQASKTSKWEEIESDSKSYTKYKRTIRVA